VKVEGDFFQALINVAGNFFFRHYLRALHITTFLFSSVSALINLKNRPAIKKAFSRMMHYTIENFTKVNTDNSTHHSLLTQKKK
jgi:hypothetical protein